MNTKLNTKNVLAKGFSLVEMLVVIAVIGIIAAIAIPSIGSINASAQTATAKRNAQNIASVYAVRPGRWRAPGTRPTSTLPWPTSSRARLAARASSPRRPSSCQGPSTLTRPPRSLHQASRMDTVYARSDPVSDPR